MSQTIVLGAKFQSFAAFQTALDEYCRENPVSKIPLAFVRQSSKKLTTNTLADELPLDQQTVDRFIYKSLSLVCVHHRSHCSKKDGFYCEGRITIRFARDQNVLVISSFVAEHLNHHTSMENSQIDNNLQQPVRDDRLNRIFALIRQMPDDEALKLVEKTCQTILEKWIGENDGLEIHLIEKENRASHMIKTEPTGKFLH